MQKKPSVIRSLQPNFFFARKSTCYSRVLLVTELVVSGIQCSITIVVCYLVVVDPGFSTGGQHPSLGQKLVIWQEFCWKLHENWQEIGPKDWGREMRQGLFLFIWISYAILIEFSHCRVANLQSTALLGIYLLALHLSWLFSPGRSIHCLDLLHWASSLSLSKFDLKVNMCRGISLWSW